MTVVGTSTKLRCVSIIFTALMDTGWQTQISMLILN